MHEVLERVEKIADSLDQQADAADELGRLPDAMALQLRDAGVMRLLQPRDFGGYAAHPVDFYETVMAVSAHSGAAGWVCGVLGLHPWEIALADPAVQAEIWGNDPDTWIASPYAPIGRARPVDGGYLLNGRWPFSSGTDLCAWIVLGGLTTDQSGELGSPPQFLHFILPRADYEIVDDSWQVMGLKGTGSKDVIVRDAFVPTYRVIDPRPLEDGTAARAAGRADPLYSMPLGIVFPGAITAATLGLAEGALAAFIAYTRGRVSMWGGASATGNPYQLAALGAAAADVQASRLHLFDGTARIYDTLAAGGQVTFEQRVEARCSQVRASRRAVDAVDSLFALAGGTSTRLSNPLQRFWRDMHAAMNHICNIAEPTYQAYGLTAFGLPVPATIKI